MGCLPRAVVSASLAASLAALAAPRASSAQVVRQYIGGDAELFGARTFDPYNGDLFSVGFGGAVHVEAHPIPLVGLHLGAAASYFLGNQSPSGTYWVGVRAGLRFHWGYLIDPRGGDGWLDAHYDFGQSGAYHRAGFDVGLGYAFRLGSGFHVGPFARFQWASDPRSNNPYLGILGITVTFSSEPAPTAGPDDADGDGVPDARDLCVHEAAGPHPDPARRGCPIRDADADTIVDAEDLCPNDAPGAHPDPTRRGCPARDTDGDGVFDHEDQCVNEPAGDFPDAHRPGCPSPDSDADGIPDSEDECSSVPAGFHPDAHRQGCPLPDRDGDTVPDAVDRCPDQAGAPSTNPARNGCANGLVRVQTEQIRNLRPIHFAHGRDTILANSTPVLAALADAIIAGDYVGVRIEGHTDTTGVLEYNMDLSQRRADAVSRWLAQHGVPEGRLQSIGYGPQRPVADNRTSAGRAANRRVEFHILNRPPSSPRREE